MPDVPYGKLVLCGIVACFDVLNLPDKSESNQVFLWPTCSSVRFLGWPNSLAAGGNPWVSCCLSCALSKIWLLADLNRARFLRVNYTLG